MLKFKNTGVEKLLKNSPLQQEEDYKLVANAQKLCFNLNVGSRHTVKHSNWSKLHVTMATTTENNRVPPSWIESHLVQLLFFIFWNINANIRINFSVSLKP